MTPPSDRRRCPPALTPIRFIHGVAAFVREEALHRPSGLRYCMNAVALRKAARV